VSKPEQCKYNIKDVKYSTDKISVIYTNADCLTNKKSEFLLLLKNCSEKPSIIAVTEVKPKNIVNKVSITEFTIDGYDIFHSGFEKENSRGNVIYIDNRLKASEIILPVSFQENLFVEIKGKNKKDNIVIGNIYRSPQSTLENNSKMYEAINYVCDNYKCKKLFVGDFNFGNINWNNWQGSSSEIQFLECLRRNFLLQHVTEPTRYRGSNVPSLLDLVISDGDFVADLDYLSPVGKSDHCVLSFHCAVTVENVDNTHKYSYSKGNYEKFRAFMDRNWEEEEGILSDNVEEVWKYLKGELENGINQFIPTCRGNSWKKKQTWSKPINVQHRELIHKKTQIMEKIYCNKRCSGNAGIQNSQK